MKNKFSFNFCKEGMKAVPASLIYRGGNENHFSFGLPLFYSPPLERGSEKQFHHQPPPLKKGD
jgi:hypothetical protein